MGVQVLVNPAVARGAAVASRKRRIRAVVSASPAARRPRGRPGRASAAACRRGRCRRRSGTRAAARPEVRARGASPARTRRAPPVSRTAGVLRWPAPGRGTACGRSVVRSCGGSSARHASGDVRTARHPVPAQLRGETRFGASDVRLPGRGRRAARVSGAADASRLDQEGRDPALVSWTVPCRSRPGGPRPRSQCCTARAARRGVVGLTGSRASSAHQSARARVRWDRPYD